jgi:hypothetical protein
VSVFLQPIYTQTVGVGGTTAVTFNNIPQGYTDLVIHSSARIVGSGSASMYMIFNGDTSQSYGQTRLGADSASVFADHDNFTQAITYLNIPSASNTANTFSNSEMRINDYSDGNFKSYFVDSVTENNSNTATNLYQMGISGSYIKTDPITSIQIRELTGGTFAQNSTFTVYGVSNLFDSFAPSPVVMGSATDDGTGQGVNVSFTPISNTDVNYYTVTSSPSGITARGTVSPINVSGLVSDTAYTFTVTATNSLGTSVQSVPSNSVTPMGAYEPIATASFSGSTSIINFTSIPQGYQHLQIRGIIRNSGANTEAMSIMTFNGDSATNYNASYSYTNGSSLTGAAVANTGLIYSGEGNGSGTTASVFSTHVTDITDYSNPNKFKAARTLTGFDTNSVGFLFINMGQWRNTAPITSVQISCGQGNYAQYSRISLYGMR